MNKRHLAANRPLGVAEAKRRFSEIIDRVQGGACVVVTRRGKAVLALVSPERAAEGQRVAPTGLAAAAGALADWADLDETVTHIYKARRRAKDRTVAELG